MQIEIAEKTDVKVRVNAQVGAEEFVEALGQGLPPFLAAMGMHISPETDYDQALRSIANDDSDTELNQVKLDCAVSFLMPRVVQEAGFVPACNPAIVGAEQLPDGSATFGVEIYPKPELELSSYGPVSITLPPVEDVTEAEIDQRVAAMAARGAVTQPDIITGKPKKVPALINDEWVRKNVEGCNTVADLRAHLREAGRVFKAEEREHKKQELAMEQMIARATSEVPAETVDAVAENMIGELVNQLAMQGLSIQEFVVQSGNTLDAIKDNARVQARSNLTYGAVLDAYFRHENLQVTEEDMQEALAAIAPGIEQEARDSLEKNGFMFTVEETAQRIRATRAIMDAAIVQE